MNQAVEEILCVFVDYAQDNWSTLLPAAELAINNRNAASTGVSPFFLIHGYHVEPLQLAEEPQQSQSARSPVQLADSIVQKLKSAVEWAQLAVAIAQQRQEEQANRSRREGPAFQGGDKVWLNLRNVRPLRPASPGWLRLFALPAVG
jgi:hypothetical protein